MGARLPLRAAGLCVIGLAATWTLAALVPIVHWHDAVALNDFTQLGRPRIDRLANGLLGLLDPLLYTLWALLLVAIALLRRRPRVALAAAIVLPAAPLSTELLKPLLAHPHARAGYQWVGAASWPSGHATAAMTLVLCALLVAPHRLRPTIAVLGSAFAVAVGFSLLILAWHMPSDVLGGYLLAALFGSLALAALRTAEARRPAGTRRRGQAFALSDRPLPPRSAAARGFPNRWHGEDLLAPAIIAVAGTLMLVVVVLLRATQVANFADEHHLIVLAAASIAALAALICSALTLELRR
ncbi:MAG TPA: phosphatase PAP2 family protein [Solirubrobacteraceae bacterium]|jgi:membrane-associated phospholipid phosphatase